MDPEKKANLNSKKQRQQRQRQQASDTRGVEPPAESVYSDARAQHGEHHSAHAASENNVDEKDSTRPQSTQIVLEVDAAVRGARAESTPKMVEVEASDAQSAEETVHSVAAALHGACVDSEDVAGDVALGAVAVDAGKDHVLLGGVAGDETLGVVEEVVVGAAAVEEAALAGGGVAMAAENVEDAVLSILAENTAMGVSSQRLLRVRV